ncbi:response regulator [Echinicola pacifica]|uniref:Response regulator n=1 Tax=Echinicola pacifica TaxID=346377 RepID=A0A918PXP5_9BACT|nr:response regulator [Echinicola pacifica]GGZ26854.1 response regulator [Echinicola pacifica]
MLSFDSIVLIDDDPINNLINKRLLRKAGICPSIVEFLEAEDALQRIIDLDKSDRLLIFLDINMPVMNGWDFLCQYQEKCPDRNDHILMLSSSIDYNDKKKSMAYQAVRGFIEKPLTSIKLFEVLPEYVKHE